MASFRKVGKNWHYRFIDADGNQVGRKGCPDRRATEGMAAAAEAEAANIKHGFIDPKARAYREHEARPLADHLADWHAFLVGKGSTANHANLSRNRVDRLIDLSRAQKISDLSPSRVQAALKAVRDAGGSLRSVHHYMRVVKGFSRWLWRDGRVREDALAHLTSLNPDADRRHERRALTPEEQAGLIRAAEAGTVVLNTSGADRAALYRLALGTGFRANELRSLTPEAFHLDGEPPTVTVAAAYSKRRRDDVQPIRLDLAEALRHWLASKAPGRPVFGRLTTHTSLMIQADLEAAGIAYRDGSDRVADFHALRHSFITSLAMSKAPVKVIQSLARHSTPTLTLGIYAHVGLYDQTSALDALPTTNPAGPATEPATLAATGTQGKHASNPTCLFPAYGGDGTGRNLSVAGKIESSNDDVNFSGHDLVSIESETLQSQGFGITGRDLSEPVGSGESWRECMGIEPTSGLSPGRSTVLKTVPVTRLDALPGVSSWFSR
jgi:integrase